MNTCEKLALLEEMLDMNEGSLALEMDLDSMDSWDSIAKLSLIVLMDDNFGKKLKGNDIKKFETVQDIVNYMET